MIEAAVDRAQGCSGACVRAGKGLLARCEDCGCFEVEYGNFRVTLEARGLLAFAKLVRQSLPTAGSRKGRRKDLYFRLTGGGARLVIPAKEIGDLWRLLEIGATWIEAELPEVQAPSILIH